MDIPDFADGAGIAGHYRERANDHRRLYKWAYSTKRLWRASEHLKAAVACDRAADAELMDPNPFDDAPPA